MINTEKQLILVRTAYLKIINCLYEKQFRMKLAVVCSYNNKWYEAKLHRIDILSSVLEHTMTENNPHRAVHYLCLLYHEINQLIDKAETDYKSPAVSKNKTGTVLHTKKRK